MTEQATKVQVFNVVILDKSGSMSSMRQAAVDGFNETLSEIKQAQQQFKDTQDHFITLALFCKHDVENVYDKVSVKDVPELTVEDLQPGGTTPLLDAIGKTLTEIENHTKDMEDYLVVVTIITDGQENSSRQYNKEQIRKLIDSLKEKNWSFTFIGANKDSFSVARQLSIDQARNFDATPKSMTSVQHEVRAQNSTLYSNLHSFKVTENNSPVPTPPAQREMVYSSISRSSYYSVPNTSSSMYNFPLLQLNQPTFQPPQNLGNNNSSDSSYSSNQLPPPPQFNPLQSNLPQYFPPEYYPHPLPSIPPPPLPPPPNVSNSIRFSLRRTPTDSTSTLSSSASTLSDSVSSSDSSSDDSTSPPPQDDKN